MPSTAFTLKLILPLALVITAASTAPAQTARPDPLYRVKSIYLGDVGALETDPFKIYLRRELTRLGFTVVDEAASADAVLTGEMTISVTEDGPPIEKPYDKLSFKLVARGSEEIWRAKFSVQQRSFDNWEKNSEHRARRLAERLKRDWKRAAGKAGLSVTKDAP